MWKVTLLDENGCYVSCETNKTLSKAVDLIFARSDIRNKDSLLIEFCEGE